MNKIKRLAIIPARLGSKRIKKKILDYFMENLLLAIL